MALILPVVGVAQIEPAGCRSYEPAVVALHGTLVRKTFAGPPNYHDIRKGDEAETYWLLNLAHRFAGMRTRLNLVSTKPRKMCAESNWCSNNGPTRSLRRCWVAELLQQVRYSEQTRDATTRLSF